jgi:tellurite resistance protein
MIVAVGILPYSRLVAEVLLVSGAAFTFGFAIWRTGGLWFGERDHTATTPVLYLPTAAGSFVSAAACAIFGHADWGQLAFGAGLFSWLAIESVLIHRLLTEESLPEALRPTLGIQLAPAPVGADAYLNLTSGPPDIFAHALIGYGLLQALVRAGFMFHSLLRLGRSRRTRSHPSANRVHRDWSWRDEAWSRRGWESRDCRAPTASSGRPG